MARLIVISGASGVGKTSLAQRLLEHPAFRRAVTATTRAPRGQEQDQVDYHFLSRERFEAEIEAGRFLEHAHVYGRLYGTPRENVEKILQSGQHCVLLLDVQGVESLRPTLTASPRKACCSPLITPNKAARPDEPRS